MFKQPSYYKPQNSIRDKFSFSNNDQSYHRPQRNNHNQIKKYHFFKEPTSFTKTRKVDFGFNQNTEKSFSGFKKVETNFKDLEKDKDFDIYMGESEEEKYKAANNYEQSEEEMEQGYLSSGSKRVSVKSISISQSLNESVHREEIESDSQSVSIPIETPVENIPEANPKLEEIKDSIRNLSGLYEDDFKRRKNLVKSFKSKELKNVLSELLTIERRECGCLAMCPSQEVTSRIKDDLRLELEQLYGENEPEVQMVKAYARFSDNIELRVKEKLRPPFILKITLDYVLKVLLSDNKGDPIDAFHFFDDRLRSIRQDFNILQTSSTLFRLGKENIQCHEYMVRFYIISINTIRMKTRKFDEYDVIKGLSETLKTLTAAYIKIKDFQKGSKLDL